jgi:dipeptidyl aminopeptidase/acylaminoacyl peptidase
MMLSEPFVPHTLDYLSEKHVFPAPLPQVFYDKLLGEYATLTDVQVSRIAYDSDGLRITGLSALPARLTPNAHPLLIYNRGGSRNYGMLTLLSAMRSMAPFARQGFLVFASNYRGNDGSEGQEQFGGDDVHDVLNLLTLARSHPGFDGKNAFMLGHSRGGMMTALAMKNGAKLNAAISIAGVADAHVMAQSPLMVERVLQPLIPGYAAHPGQSLSERSMLDWPEAISAPLLLLHGDADDVVPADQSIRMAEALQQLGKPHALHLYPGGNHALVRHWDAVIARCSDWLEAHRA